MYETHWGLTESPFRSPPASRFVRLSSTQDEAHARLQFLVEHGRRLGIVWGGAGVGKTLLLQTFAEESRRRGQRSSYLTPTGVSGGEFLQELATRLGLHPERALASWELWNRVFDCLRVDAKLGIGRVLLIDDVDQAEASVMAVLLRLVQQELPSGARFTVLLAADAGHPARLDPRLVEQSELRIELEPWSFTETAAYLEDVLAMAGCRRTVFREAAIQRLHEVTAGVPRRIVQLADWALLAAASHQQREIDEATILAVHTELCPAAA
jgi:type II secretory pathway predicted ATPase ExeA